jgi:hypothetical protein
VDRASLASPDHRFVSNDDASCRMFAAGWMESLSHVRPWVPHLVFIPAIVAALVTALRADNPGRVVVLVCGGLLFWTVTEYVIHRFFFHPPQWIEDDTRRIAASLGPGDAVISALPTWRHKFYFLVHGVHHDYPNDSTRLVMPPSVRSRCVPFLPSVPRGVGDWCMGRVRRICHGLPRVRHDPFCRPPHQHPGGLGAHVETAALPPPLL